MFSISRAYGRQAVREAEQGRNQRSAANPGGRGAHAGASGGVPGSVLKRARLFCVRAGIETRAGERGERRSIRPPPPLRRLDGRSRRRSEQASDVRDGLLHHCPTPCTYQRNTSQRESFSPIRNSSPIAPTGTVTGSESPDFPMMRRTVLSPSAAFVPFES